MTHQAISGRMVCTVPEAGQLLGLTRSAAYRAAGRGEIPTLTLGRRLVVPIPKLMALLGATPDMDEAGIAIPADATANEASKEPRHDHYLTQQLRSA